MLFILEHRTNKSVDNFSFWTGNKCNVKCVVDLCNWGLIELDTHTHGENILSSLAISLVLSCHPMCKSAVINWWEKIHYDCQQSSNSCYKSHPQFIFCLHPLFRPPWKPDWNKPVSYRTQSNKIFIPFSDTDFCFFL